MFKWIEQLQQTRIDLKHLAESKTPKEFEQKIEALLEKLSTSPQVLNSLSLALNTQAHIKSLVNFGFDKLWKNIQLPNKKDQERTLYMLHELQFKLHQMEKEITRLKSAPVVTHSPLKTRPFAVINKHGSDGKTVSKLV